MSDHQYLAGISADKLAGLVFELASQLHVERQRRMALERLLARAGAIDPAALDALADDADFLAQSRAALDAALRRLLRVVTEGGESQAPLRPEALRRDAGG